MPPPRFRRGRRRTTDFRNKKFIKNSKTAKSQQKQIMSIQRQLTATKRKVRDRAQWSQWTLPLEPASTGSQIDLTDGEFYVVGLTRPAAMTGIFQSTNAQGQPPVTALNSNIATYRSCDIQLLFSPVDSLTPMTPRIIRVYVVSLKKDTAADTLQLTNGMNSAGLNAVAPGVLTHITNSDGGVATLVKLNPAAFRIHHYREFTLANIVQETAVVPDPDSENVAITNTGDALKRVRIRMRMNTKIKPATGRWPQMTEADIMPTERKFLIVHVGGWASLASTTVHMDSNIVFNMRETN